MPFQETKEGATNFCPHTADNTICDKCLGKNEEIEFLLSILYKYLRIAGIKPKDALLEVQRSRNKLL